MNTEEKLVDLLNKAEDFATGQGYELALAATRVNAIQDIIFAIFFLIMGIVSLKTLLRYSKIDDYDFDSFRYWITTVASVFGMVYGSITKIASGKML